MHDLLLTNCHVATMAGGVPYGAVRDAAIAITNSKTAWVGARASAPAAKETRDLRGAWVTPGLIDCHTHLVFGGDRAAEWEARLNGATYEEIARKGGGIASTVKATRAASEDDLAASARARLDAMTAHGATTVEVKSGYGLDLDSEKKMLRAAAKLTGARVVRTFLGAHAVPPEFAGDREMYVDLICDTMIPVIAREKLADAVDAFCESIGFTHAETMRVFEAAKKHGLPVKLHAEQLSDMGGAALACQYNALSVDHLEHLSDTGIAAMKSSGTVAVLLPCAYYFLRDTKLPPVEKLRVANIPMAVATDCNPGTSPCTSPLLAMNMACTLFRLTPEEALRGMTVNAARALGMHREIGTIEVGKYADLAAWRIDDPSELAYWMGADLLLSRYLAGEEMNDTPRNVRAIRAPRGPERTCQTWAAEAAMRMLMNNLDAEVAERPEDLVVYGGIGKAARNWEAFDRIVASLKSLAPDETLLVQSGKPVGIFRTHTDAPRVLIANSNIVPHWATWEKFRELDRLGLMMYGQMTAGSWIYIGSQGIVQGTYETFVEVGRRHYNGDLSGRWILTAGLGGMGGAQTLAATMAGASCLAIECQRSRIEKRLQTRYVDRAADNLDDALRLIDESVRAKKPISVGLLGNAAEILPELVKRGVRPDAVTDQTSAHDLVNGYLPAGWTVAEWEDQRVKNPERVVAAAKKSIVTHVQAMLDFWKAGVPTLDYGNNIRQVAKDEGLEHAFDFPGFVPAYIRPLFCRGIGPFRWAALSGDPEDIFRTDAAMKKLFPDNRHLHQWLDMAQERIAFQGLPARICWIGLGDRHRAGLMFNDMVAKGEVSAPIVIGRDHLDSGSVASPNRETEAMQDGSDAVSDWPMLNALLNTASGASWVSIHHGGGVGMGFSQHAGVVIVADGTPEAARRLERVLWNDPATGVMRHADAGYDIAKDSAREHHLNLPSLGTK